MKLRNTPVQWRKDWTLHRAIPDVDSGGDPVRRWDMEHPAFTGTAKTPSGVAWHIQSGAAAAQEYGEDVTGAAVFLLDMPALEIAPFDRCVFGGRVWEVRGVLERSGFRTVKLTEVGPA